MEKTLDYDYIFKYILIGDASVGKSTILNRFVNDSYTSESNPTMGVEFATKKIVVGGSTIKVQIWDTVPIELARPDSSPSAPSPEPTIKMRSESCWSSTSTISRPSRASTPGSPRSTTIPTKQHKLCWSVIRTTWRVLQPLLLKNNYLSLPPAPKQGPTSCEPSKG
jgi:hypothetical protein